MGGCKLFGKKSELYTQSVESRPLEVPPDLDRPAADRAMTLPDSGGSVSASGMNNAGGSSAAPIGFNATGDRDAIFVKVGEVLGTTAGVSVVNRAQTADEQLRLTRSYFDALAAGVAPELPVAA